MDAEERLSNSCRTPVRFPCRFGPERAQPRISGSKGSEKSRGRGAGLRLQWSSRRRAHHETTSAPSVPLLSLRASVLCEPGMGRSVAPAGQSSVSRALDKPGLCLCTEALGACVVTGSAVFRLQKGVRRSKVRPPIRCICEKTPWKGAAGRPPPPAQSAPPRCSMGGRPSRAFCLCF